MKSKTSITLSTVVLEELDRIVGASENRSVVIERAVQEYIYRLKRSEDYKRELALLNGKAKSLNKEAEDVLSYQVEL
jgi:metal-responsive CopG/Arc/MetJ family transcriptional regulator